jgi:endonuclease/exonuclease/phosphatase family metal-dependent hydrolase
MKVVFLNSWGGKAGQPFTLFIKKQAPDTDIFLFQEVSPQLLLKISAILPGYRVIYEKGWNLRKKITWYGQAAFLRKDLKARSFGRIPIFKSGKTSGFMQYLLIQKGTKSFYACNVHGKSKPGHKFDTGARIAQSKSIVNFLKNKKGPKIIGGDFNLMPDTRSVKMFEDNGYKNLIKEFGIKSTRNRISWEQFRNEEGFIKQHFADYVFVSPSVKVKSFSVPSVEVSDHLPLILEFEI